MLLLLLLLLCAPPPPLAAASHHIAAQLHGVNAIDLPSWGFAFSVLCATNLYHRAAHKRGFEHRSM
jgi:hypothetical protein